MMHTCNVSAEDVGFVIPRTKGGYVIGQERKLCAYDWETNKVQVITQV